MRDRVVKENKRRGEPGLGLQGRGGEIPNTHIMLALFPLNVFHCVLVLK